MSPPLEINRSEIIFLKMFIDIRAAETNVFKNLHFPSPTVIDTILIAQSFLTYALHRN